MVARPADKTIDTLKISEAEHQRLLANLESMADHFSGHNKRADVRFPLSGIRAMMLQVEHPGGTRSGYIVRPRNISNGGMGVFHGGFIHAGTHCEVALGRRRDELIRLGGSIRHCRLISGRVHEVGVQFEQPIRVEDFIDVDTSGENGTQYRLAGRVLCFDETIEESRLLEFQLQEMGANALVAADETDLIRLMGHNRPDLAMIGENVPSGAFHLAQQIKAAGYNPQLVLMSGNGRPTINKEAAAAGYRSVLVKPYEPSDLTRTVRGVLERSVSHSDSADGPLLSAFWENAKIRPLILNYLDTMEEWVVSMEEAQRSSDAATLARRARELKTSAGNYGFPAISVAGSRLEKLVAGEPNPDELQAMVYEVGQLVRTACSAVHPDSTDTRWASP